MRWNGVFVLGVGLSAIGFAAMAQAYLSHAAAGAPERMMAFATGILVAGALVTAIGAFLAHRRGLDQTSPTKRSRLFGGDSSHYGPSGNRFGRRGSFAPKPTSKTEPVGKAAPLLAIGGPK